MIHNMYSKLASTQFNVGQFTIRSILSKYIVVVTDYWTKTIREIIDMTDENNQPTQPPPEKLSTMIVSHSGAAISLCPLQLAMDATRANSTFSLLRHLLLM